MMNDRNSGHDGLAGEEGMGLESLFLDAMGIANEGGVVVRF
jgi:hypothetical protein